MIKQVRTLTTLLLLLLAAPLGLIAQGHKGQVSGCAPMVDGKVCYQDDVEMNGKSDAMIYDAIQTWAKETYGKDLFISNMRTSQKNGTIRITSRIELLLNDTEKTVLKYHMNIQCFHHRYTIEVTKLEYLYNPENKDSKRKKYKKYSAEKILANNGKGNTVPQIKDAELFCNATFFFVENLFSEVYDAVID